MPLRVQRSPGLARRCGYEITSGLPTLKVIQCPRRTQFDGPYIAETQAYA
jgi:hypothetical protein